MSLLLASALVLTAVDDRRIAFESGAEPVPVIVERLAHELDLPLTVGDEFRDQRLVIYAPDVDGHELLNKVAWSIYAEWVPGPRGGYTLRSTEATRHEQEADLHKFRLARGLPNLQATVADYAEQMSSDWQRLVLEHLENLQRYDQEPRSSRRYPVNLRAANLAPRRQMVARLLALLPSAAFDTTNEVSISTVPGAGDYDFSRHRLEILNSFRLDQEIWRSLLTQYRPEDQLNVARTRTVFSVLASEAGRALPSNTYHFSARIRQEEDRFTARVQWFDESGGHLGRENAILINRLSGPYSRDGAFTGTQLSQTIFPVVNFSEEIDTEHFTITLERLADAGWWRQTDELQLRFARIIGSEKNQSIVFPALTLRHTMGQDHPFAHFIEQIDQTNSYFDSLEENPFIVDSKSWFGIRKGPVEPMKHRPIFADEERTTLISLAQQALDQQGPSFQDYVRLAGAVQDEIWYRELAHMLFSASRRSLDGFESHLMNSFRWMLMLYELTQGDISRLNGGASMQFRSLSAAAREIVHEAIFHPTFVDTPERVHSLTDTTRRHIQNRPGSYLSPNISGALRIRAYTRREVSLHLHASPSAISVDPRLSHDCVLRYSAPNPRGTTLTDPFENEPLLRFADSQLRYLEGEFRRRELTGFLGRDQVIVIEFSYQNYRSQRELRLINIDTSRSVSYANLPPALRNQVDHQMARLRSAR